MRKIAVLLLLSVSFVLITYTCFAQHRHVIKLARRIDSSSQDLQKITNKGRVTTNKITIANLNLSNVPAYSSQDSSNEDLIKLPVNSAKNSLLAIAGTSLSEDFTYTIDNTDGASRPAFQIANRDSLHFNLKVSWGDGSIDQYTSYAGYICTHRYNSNRVFTVSITINDTTIPTFLAINNDFNASSNQMTSISNVSKLINLKWLYLEWNRLPAALIDTIQLPAGLKDLGIRGNYLGTYNPVNLPSTLVYLDVGYNNLTSIPVSVLPAYLRYCSFQENRLSSSEVNNLLVQFDNNGVTDGQLTLIGQTPAASPGVEGLAAKSSLEVKGWQVTTD